MLKSDLIIDVSDLNWISNDYEIDEENAIITLKKIQDKYNFTLTKKVINFLLDVNGKMFFDWVLYTGIEDVPVLNGNKGDVGLFYSLKEGTQYDLIDAMKSNSDIFESTDMLFAEASPGDFLVISLAKNDFGRIFFISHDFSEEENHRFLVANCIDDFIQTLFIKEE